MDSAGSIIYYIHVTKITKEKEENVLVISKEGRERKREEDIELAEDEHNNGL